MTTASAHDATAATGSTAPATPPRLRLATAWLAGCSGCHMSFLDLDELLFVLAERVELVYSPVASDIKTYPEAVDICLVEGAVANTANLELALQLRARTALVISFGDCAVTANVPALRNLLNRDGRGGAEAVLQRSYVAAPCRDSGGSLSAWLSAFGRAHRRHPAAPAGWPAPDPGGAGDAEVRLMGQSP